MPTFQGQTDQVLKIQLQSFIVSAHWLEPQASAGGETRLEVMTAYVGDTAPIEVAVFDRDGKECVKLQGSVRNQVYRTKVVIPADAIGPLRFKAKLPKHGLEAQSGDLKVLPKVVVQNLQWLDGDGQADRQTLSAWKDGSLLTCEAQCLGAPEQAEALIVLSVKTAHGLAEWLQAPAQVAQSKVTVTFRPRYAERANKLKTQADLHPTGESYAQPELVFHVRCLGASGESAPLPVIQTKLLIYEMAPGQAGDFAGKTIKVTDPSGAVTDYAIPENGRIEIEQTKPGYYAIDESAVAHLL